MGKYGVIWCSYILVLVLVHLIMELGYQEKQASCPAGVFKVAGPFT